MRAETCVNLCFHGVGTPARDLEPGEARYWVDEKAFLDLLDAVTGWPSVRLSFDDGNASDVVTGLPALQERGLTATFFVLAGRLDSPGSLGGDDLRALRDAGMTIGTHGMHHVPWRGLDARQQHDELVRARERIAEVVGRPVDEAACPLGRYDRALLTTTRRLGYTRVHTSDRRPARATAVVQPRFSVRADDTVEGLRAEVRRSARPVRGSVLAAKEALKRLR